MQDTHIPNPVQLRPIAEAKGADKRVWGIPLGGVWLPYFTATNTMGESNIPAEVLGAPVRLAFEKDGTPRFSKSGRPVMRVVKELSDQVRVIRENMTFALLAYASTVQKAQPDAYKGQVEAALKAGVPLINKDAHALDAYLEKVTADLEKDKAKAEIAEKELVPA